MTVEIVRTPDILHGKPRIEGTRIGVHHVGVPIREHGRDRAAVADSLGLTDAEIDVALDYYDTHPDEMAAIQRKKDATAARLREQSRAPE